MDWIIHRALLRPVALALVISAALQLQAHAALEDPKDSWSGFSSACATNDSRNASVSCYGVRIVRKIVQQFLEKTSKEPNIEIFEGVSLVEVPGGGASPRKARVLKDFAPLGPLLQFLEGRELRIKLPTLLPQSIENAVQEGLRSDFQARGSGGGGYGGGGGGYGGGGGGGGGGKKGGGGGYMILALMMGKMMAMMAMGGVGMLAMKALIVSWLALMLSAIIAVKKLASGHDDGGGHHVVYAQEVGHHHRRRREAGDDETTDLPYRGYAHIFGDARVAR